MLKIVYKTTNGEAHDLRFVPEDYILKSKETLLEGNKLPDINTLHSAEYLAKQQAKEDSKQALRDKHKGKKASELTDADVIEWNRYKMAEELEL